RARASRLTRSSAPSPNRASETGASIPAATSDAPSPCDGSARTTSSPAAAPRQAIAVPMTPPPAMTTSAVTATPFAGITRIRYDGRRRAASLSALRAPVFGNCFRQFTLYQRGPGARPGTRQWLDSPVTSDLRARLADARLYLCTGSRRSQGDLPDCLAALLDAGVAIVQLREKALEAGEELGLLEVFAAACRRHGRLLAVNDRADVALAAGADVLHLGQDDLPVPVARRILGR